MREIVFFETKQPADVEIGRVRLLDDGKVQYQNLPPKLQASLDDGIAISPRERITFKDGDRFMDAILDEYSGAYLRAAEVQR